LPPAGHPSLSQSAVHEFLKGQRQLELPSIEALLRDARYTTDWIAAVVRQVARNEGKVASHG
jgi:hypothetical protein